MDPDPNLSKDGSASLPLCIGIDSCPIHKELADSGYSKNQFKFSIEIYAQGVQIRVNIY